MTSPVGGTLAQTAVEIIADFDRFEPEAKAKLAAAMRAAGLKAEEVLDRHTDRMADNAGDAGKKAGEEFGKGLGEGIDKTSKQNERRSRDSGGRAGDAYGGRFAQTVKKRISSALDALPEPQIGVATDAFEQELKDLHSQLRELGDQTVGVDIDTTFALSQLDRIRQRLDAIGAESPNVQVKIDSAFASAELAKVTAQIEKVSAVSPTVDVDADTAAAQAGLAGVHAAALAAGQDVTVNVDADTGGALAQLAALRAASGGASSGLVGIAIAGAALAPAIVPAAGLAIAAIAALATVAGAGVAGVGVLALGFWGVGEAVSAMGDAQSDTAKSGASLLGQQIAIANALDGVRSAEASLANIRANASEAALRAAERIGAAQRGVATAQREAADGIAQAIRRQQDAERALSGAQESARRAQTSLTDARRDASRALQDLKAQTQGGVLAEQQAFISLARARADLQKSNGDRSASILDRAQAALDVKFAEQRLNDQKTINERLAEDKAAADRAGIEGSRQVVAATDQIRDAILRVADAQRGLADAGRGVDQARIEGAERVADAQRGLTEAIRAQATEQRQAAFSIAQAQQGVIQAQRSLQQATAQAGAGGSESMNKLKKAMDALSPAGQAFALFLFGLKPLLSELKASAEGGLLPGVEAGIKALLPFFPQINAFVGQMAKLLGDLFLAGATALTDPFWRDFFGFMATIAGPTLKTMFEIVMNVARGFAGLLKAFFPVSEDLGGGLLDLSKDFADFGASAENNPGFQKFLAYLKENGPKVVAFLGSLIGAVGNVIKALAPFAGPILDGVTAVFNFIKDLPTGELQILIGIIGGVTAAVWLLNLALAANPIVLIGIAIAAVGVLLVLAFNRFEGFRNVVTAVFNAVATAALWLWHNVLEPAFNAWWSFAQTMASVYLWLWKNVLQPVFEGIGAVISWWWTTIVTPVFNAVLFVVTRILAPIFTWLWKNVISPAFAGIAFAISLAWTSIKVVFGLIQIALKIVAAPFLFLWRNVVMPVFRGIADIISNVWNTRVKPILSALGSFIETNVVPAFKRGVTAIGKAWDAIQEAAKKPVRFVLATVINGGILAAYNRVAKIFKVKPDNVSVPMPFAKGGIYAPNRYTPGRDIGYAAVSGYEAIMRPEWTRAVGPSYVHAANRAARTGGVGGVRRFMGGYADGGIVGLIKNPGGFIKGLTSGALGKLKGIADNDFGRVIASAMRRVSDGLASNIKSLFSFSKLSSFLGGLLGEDGPNASGGPSGSSYPAIIAMMRRLGVPFNVSSTYRQGAHDYHGRGMAVDAYSSAANMNRLAERLYQHSSYLKELIHSKTFGIGEGWYVKDGKRVSPNFYRSAGDHSDHVHTAATNAAMAKLVKQLPQLANGGVFNKPLIARVAEAGKEVVVPLTRPRRAVQLARDSGLIDLLIREGAIGGGGPRTSIHAPITVESNASDPEIVAVRTVAALVRAI